MSIGPANLYYPDTVANEIMATHITVQLSRLMSAYDDSFVGGKLVLHWSYYLTDDEYYKVVESSSTEALKASIMVETRRNPLISSGYKVKEYLTESKVGDKISPNLSKSLIKTGVVIRVTNRDSVADVDRPHGKVYTEYAITDIYFLSPLSMWWQITGKVGSYVRVANGHTVSYRQGVLKVYVQEPSRLIPATVSNRIFRDMRIGAFDFETYTNEIGEVIPITCVIKTMSPPKGNKRYNVKRVEVIESLYVTDYENSLSMVKSVINLMCQSNKTYWYAQKIGRFDGIFIVRALCEMNQKYNVI